MNLPARPYTKAEKHLDFNFKVAVKLLRNMGSNSGCTFIACPTHHHELLVAIEACKLEGLRFSVRNIAIMAYGEETEKQQRFKSYPSFARLDAVLGTIFGGCKRCVTEMPIQVTRWPITQRERLPADYCECCGQEVAKRECAHGLLCDRCDALVHGSVGGQCLEVR